MATNVHKVPQKQWRKWRGTPQAMYNRMWLRVKETLLQQNRKPDYVLIHNLCWEAADVQKELAEDVAAGWFIKTRR